MGTHRGFDVCLRCTLTCLALPQHKIKVQTLYLRHARSLRSFVNVSSTTGYQHLPTPCSRINPMRVFFFWNALPAHSALEYVSFIVLLERPVDAQRGRGRPGLSREIERKRIPAWSPLAKETTYSYTWTCVPPSTGDHPCRVLVSTTVSG